MKRTLVIAIAMAGLGGTLALAHPHEKETTEPAKKSWPFFGSRSEKQKIEKRTLEKIEREDNAQSSDAVRALEKQFKRHAERMSRGMDRAMKKNERGLKQFEGSDFLENPEDLREAARALEKMFDESNFFENMADLVIDLAEDFDIESGDDGMVLRFDGKTLGSINIERDGHIDESVTLEGLGKNVEIEKETFFKDGKKKRRIIIEMDADD